MKPKDTNREFVCRFDNGMILYRVLAGGKVPYSIIEGPTGYEMFSCERSGETAMIKAWCYRKDICPICGLVVKKVPLCNHELSSRINPGRA